MKMAIGIQCHKNSNQVNKLIEFFYDDEIDLYLHVDKKSNIINELNLNENVYLVKDRENVRWGDFSQVEATIKILKLIKSKNKEYDYIHLISGQDYPVKKLDTFKNFFKNKEKQYMENYVMPVKFLSKNGEDRYTVYYPRWIIDRPQNKLKRIIRIIYREIVLFTKILKRKVDFVDDIYFGSSWFSITGECMNYILDYIENNKKFYEFFKNSIYADEMFFQTIVLNSRFKDNTENNNLRYMNWSESNSSPKTLDVNDVELAYKTSNFFARKIEDINVIKYLEKNIKEIE